MLPGFRFLFAAIMLSTSLLVFGLGAASLLRAAHEEFASNPSWRAAPEVTFAQPVETTKPVLAMVRVDLPAEAKQDDAPATPAAAEPTAVPSAPADPEPIAALKPEDSSPAEEIAKGEPATAEAPAAVIPATGEAASNAVEQPASTDEPKIAAVATPEAAPQENQTAPAPSEPMDTQAALGADIAATKIATLGGPPVSIETPPPAKVSHAKPEQSAIKKRQQARRTVQRRRMATRSRLAQTPQQPANPFGQPAPTIRTR